MPRISSITFCWLSLQHRPRIRRLHHLPGCHSGPSILLSYLGQCRGLLTSFPASAFAPSTICSLHSCRALALKWKSDIVTLLECSRVQRALPSTHIVRSKAFSLALSCRPIQSAARSTQPQHPYLGLSPRLPLPSTLGPSSPLQAPSTAQLFPLPPGSAPKQASLPSQVSLH